MANYQLSASDLENHLAEQLGFLQRSARIFDEGYANESKRIAVILRVLLHTGRYPSLLKQVGRDNVKFVDTASEYDPENLISTNSLVALRSESGSDDFMYVPSLDGLRDVKMTDFGAWWRAIVFADMDGRKMSRSDVVLTAADQDGGAHVDASLRGDYAALGRENSLGLMVKNERGLILPIGDAGYVAIRQIAHEVLKTLVDGYSLTSDDVSAARKLPEISGGKMRFMPYGKFFFQFTAALPVNEGALYEVEMKIDSITFGSVMAVVGSAVSGPVITAGLHEFFITAGSDQKLGIFGEFTDAIIDHITVVPSLRIKPEGDDKGC